jgi:ADP-heptose:LPS heptosyltransferase
MKAPTKSILVIRLSSLGDLILSLAFVESLPPGVFVDWVTTDAFGFLLEGHPRVRKLYLYSKKSGLFGWLKLMSTLAKTHYDARVDLHVNLRSHLARVVFRLHGHPVLKLNKQRVRTWGYFIFKKCWPSSWRPTPYWKRFAAVALEVARRLSVPGAAETPPMFPLEVSDEERTEILRRYQLEKKRYLVVMPASKWPSKEWGAKNYAQALILWSQSHPREPIVVLGRESDLASVELLRLLESAGVPTRSALCEPHFVATGVLIEQSRCYLGGDTGLAHLAEAVGTQAVVVFGPTQPGVGFGPWREQSQSVSSEVWCSPCSKDGRVCFRVDAPYACFKQLSPQSVLTTIQSRSHP